MTYALPITIALFILALCAAWFFALDWYRMRGERDWLEMQAKGWEQLWREDWQDFHHMRAQAWWQDISAPHLDVMPRGPDGRFVKRSK